MSVDQTKNENRAMGEQAKVGRKLKLPLGDQAGKRSSRELRKYTFFLVGLPLLIRSDEFFSNILFCSTSFKKKSEQPKHSLHFERDEKHRVK